MKKLNDIQRKFISLGEDSAECVLFVCVAFGVFVITIIATVVFFVVILPMRVLGWLVHADQTGE